MAGYFVTRFPGFCLSSIRAVVFKPFVRVPPRIEFLFNFLPLNLLVYNSSYTLQEGKVAGSRPDEVNEFSQFT
jgi:hypothetical protein